MDLNIVEAGYHQLKTNYTKSVCVFCGSREGSKPEYKLAAIELGKLLSEVKFRLVYGGGNLGLMGALASSAQQNNCEILGIIPQHLMEREVGKTNLKNLIITKNMHERKNLMYNESDAIMILPGGVGTLDEFFEIITWGQLGLHKKYIFLLNIDGFWSPLLNLLAHQVNHGFMDKSINNLFSVVATPREAINYLIN
jgi:uncharacterized protein (TIGR00730 family)